MIGILANYCIWRFVKPMTPNQTLDYLLWNGDLALERADRGQNGLAGVHTDGDGCPVRPFALHFTGCFRGEDRIPSVATLDQGGSVAFRHLAMDFFDGFGVLFTAHQSRVRSVDNNQVAAAYGGN
jgi:hypothetical protein